LHKTTLNPIQKEAATTTEGPVLIIVGPGSGSYTTLKRKMTEHMLEFFQLDSGLG
jgi:superfamily I DNA/RNA helicase